MKARIVTDKFLKLGIKLCMLAGVAFTFAACYGPPPERWYEQEPDFQQAQQKTEKQLQAAAQEGAPAMEEKE